jgi:hypothetical protein
MYGTGQGNIDHIAIGPGGLLTIETKSYAGKVSEVVPFAVEVRGGGWGVMVTW